MFSATIYISQIKKLVAFTFGFCLTLYFPVAPPIKVVDVFCLLSFFVFLRSIQKPTISVVFLTLSILVVFFSTIINAFRTGLLTNEIILAALSSVIALIAFLTLVSMRRIELEAFIAGFLVSIILICTINLLGAWGLIPEILPQYNSRYGERSIGGMPDPNRFGFVLVVSLCFLLPLALLRKKPLIPWISVFIVTVSIVALGQRSAIIVGFIVFCLAVFLFAMGRWGKNSVFQFTSNRLGAVMILGIFCFCIIALLPIPQVGGSVFESIPISQKVHDRGISLTEDVRAEKMEAGFRTFFNRPLIGHGFDGYRLYAGAGTSHNYYIEKMVNGGAAATFFLLGFLVLIGVQFYRTMYLGNYFLKNWVVGGGALTFVAIFVYGSVLNIHYLVAAYALLGLIANKGFRANSSFHVRNSVVNRSRDSI